MIKMSLVVARIVRPIGGIPPHRLKVLNAAKKMYDKR